MRPPVLMAHPSLSPLPQHILDPQDLKGDRQQDSQERSNVVGVSHPHLQTDAHNGEMGTFCLLPRATEGHG